MRTEKLQNIHACLFWVASRQGENSGEIFSASVNCQEKWMYVREFCHDKLICSKNDRPYFACYILYVITICEPPLIFAVNLFTFTHQGWVLGSIYGIMQSQFVFFLPLKNKINC